MRLRRPSPRLERLESRLTPGFVTWDGGGANANWTTPANWVGDVAPTPNAVEEVLVFPAGAARLANTNDFPAGSRFARLDFRGPGYQIGGNALTLDFGITAESPSPVAPADFPRLVVGITQAADHFLLSGDNNLGIVLDAPLTVNDRATVFGRCTVNGVVSGPGAIGTGGFTSDLVLTAVNANTGGVFVGGGSVRIDGSTPASAPVIVSGSSTTDFTFLRGSGSVGNVSVGFQGVLAPGASGPSTLRANGLTVNNQGAFSVDIIGSAAGAYDQVIVATDVRLGGRLIVNVGGTLPGPGATLRIIDNAGANAVTDTFRDLPEGALVTTAGVRLRITYAGGDGNDVELVADVAPLAFTWDGGGTDANWTTAANWAGDVAPAAGAALYFPVGAAQLTSTNDFAAGTAFDSLLVAPGHVLTGNAVNLANGIAGATTVSTAGQQATVNLGITLAAAQQFSTNNDALTLVVGGPVNLNGSGLTKVDGPVSLTGAVSGAGGIVVSTGNLTLSGNNTYTGMTDVRFLGSLQVGSGNALGATGAGNDTRLANGTRLTLVNATGGPVDSPEAITFGSVNGNAYIVLPESNAGPLTLSGPLTLAAAVGISASPAAPPLIVAGTLTGNGYVEGGNLVIAASSVSPNYTREIFGGYLRVDGQIPNASVSAILLTGTGTVGSAGATDSGIISPGDAAVGTLTTGGLGVVEGEGGPFPRAPGVLRIDVGPGGADQVRVTGSVYLGGVLDLAVAPGFVPALGSRYRIIDNDGTDAVTRVSFGSFPADGAVVKRFGNIVLRITLRGGDGNDVELVAGPPGGRIAVGAGAGGGPQVNIFAEDNSLIRAFNAYDLSFRGGVRVAQGDFTGDGIDDVVTAPGTGGGPHVRVWDGATGGLLSEFLAYAPNFTGGVNIAVGDVTNDGVLDIVTGAGVGGGPHVRVFTRLGTVEGEFLAYDPAFRGGVSVTVGAVGENSVAEIVTGAGPGGGSHVKVFTGVNGTLASQFLAFDNFFGGVSVSVVGGQVAVAPLAGGGPVVRVFGVFTDGVAQQYQFLAFAEAFRGGVVLATRDVDSDGVPDLVAGPGPGGGPHVAAFEQGGSLKRSFLAFDPAFLGGIFVG